MIDVYFEMGMLILGFSACVMLGWMLRNIHLMQKQTNGMLVTLKAMAYSEGRIEGRKEGHDAAERGQP